jgi:hypothetical protein
MKYAFAIVYLLLFYGWILPAMAQNKAKTPASTTPPRPLHLHPRPPLRQPQR